MTRRKPTKNFSREIPKNCLFCERDYLGYRDNVKFCSSVCRCAWQARNQSNKSKLRRQEYQKKWGVENWLRRRNYMINFTYGISPEQYQELLEKQNYSCAICGRHETEFGRKLAIDHDHGSNEIFGLLCGPCNHRVIGKIRDPNVFLKAAEYLKQGTGWFVPKRTRKKRKRK